MNKVRNIQRKRGQTAAWHTDADLFQQWEEAEERAKKWQEQYKKEKQAHEQEVSELRSQFRRDIQEIARPLVERMGIAF